MGRAWLQCTSPWGGGAGHHLHWRKHSRCLYGDSLKYHLIFKSFLWELMFWQRVQEVPWYNCFLLPLDCCFQSHPYPCCLLCPVSLSPEPPLVCVLLGWHLDCSFFCTEIVTALLTPLWLPKTCWNLLSTFEHASHVLFILVS